MDDPRLEFLATLDLEQMRIKNFPGFIFLCGGQRPEPLTGPPYQSIRHHLLDHIRVNNAELMDLIVVAETFSGWLDFDTYHDLVTFERHLAGVANVIPIILESYGAIAELGAFSQEPQIASKLLVFRREHFAEHTSFINLGLLKFIEQGDSEKVLTYPWGKSLPEEGHQSGPDDPAIVADIANDIAKQVKDNSHKTQKFRADHPGHVMILIDDLLKLMVGLKLGEIVGFLGKIGIQINEKTVSQYLFLLSKLKIIGDKHYGSRFYFSRSIWAEHVDFAFHAGTPQFDRAIFMEKLEAYYKAENDKRLNASRAFIASQEGN